MKVHFMGAARTVTGSCYIVEAAGARFAVDCGMHQGNSDMENRNYETESYRPGDIDFVLLTHAHIDHSGLLPRIVREGFKGPIYCTPPTVELVSMMLEDSGHIQEMEASWNAKHKSRLGETDHQEALYTVEDALKVPAQLRAVNYEQEFSPKPGIKVIYRNAGHILGAAFLRITVEEDGKTVTSVFSGDVGRPGTLLMFPAETPVKPDYIFLEGTYGNRNHKNEDASLDELHEAILYAHKHNEKVIIPAFAVGRTQELLYSLFLLHRQGRLPEKLPVYVDSPMAIKATEIFSKYKEYLNMPELKSSDGSIKNIDLPNLHFTLSAQESQALNANRGPGVIIAASGMANAGRIKHHLRHNAWRPGAAIVFVGYQGVGTPGRRIVDGAKSIRMFNEDVAIKAKIFTIGGFSAHAGQSQLLDWLEDMRHPAMQVVLVHGENMALETLSQLIQERFKLPVVVPRHMEEMTLKPGQTPVVQRDESRKPTIDWTYLLKSTDEQLTALRAKLGDMPGRAWNDQVDACDRLLDLRKELDKLLSQL